MQITIYKNFSKRINSTKQPTGGTTVNVLLKNECSILEPVFELNLLDFEINYVQAFGHFYFADVVNLDGHRSELHCRLDHLATFKTQIRAYTGYVEYTSASSDVTITDPRNLPTALVTATPTSMTFSGINFNTVGGYILGVLSDGATGNTGVIDYYGLTQAQMGALCNELYSQNILDQIKDQFTNAMDSLVSCIWLPVTGIGSGGYSVHIGRETLGFSNNVAKITDRMVSFTTGLTSLNFSSISGGSGANMTYLEKAPFATGLLYLPFVGIVPLDLDIAAYAKSVQIDGWIDLLTGDITYKVRYGGVWVSTYNGNAATKLPVTAASYDGVGIATGALTAIGGLAAAVSAIATGGAALPGIAAAGAGLMHAAKSSEFHSMINGGNSSAIAANLGTNPFAMIYQNTPTYTNLLGPKAEQGMPYFKVATLSALSGFIKCSDASVNIPGDGAEQDTVNSYLNSGFYLE